MAGIIKSNVSKIQTNPISAVAGAGAGYWVMKKYGRTTSWVMLSLAAVVGGLIGANVSSMVKTKMNAPSKKDLK